MAASVARNTSSIFMTPLQDLMDGEEFWGKHEFQDMIGGKQATNAEKRRKRRNSIGACPTRNLASPIHVKESVTKQITKDRDNVKLDCGMQTMTVSAKSRRQRRNSIGPCPTTTCVSPVHSPVRQSAIRSVLSVWASPSRAPSGVKYFAQDGSGNVQIEKLERSSGHTIASALEQFANLDISSPVTSKGSKGIVEADATVAKSPWGNDPRSRVHKIQMSPTQKRKSSIAMCHSPLHHRKNGIGTPASPGVAAKYGYGYNEDGLVWSPLKTIKATSGRRGSLGGIRPGIDRSSSNHTTKTTAMRRASVGGFPTKPSRTDKGLDSFTDTAKRSKRRRNNTNRSGDCRTTRTSAKDQHRKIKERAETRVQQLGKFISPRQRRRSSVC